MPTCIYCLKDKPSPAFAAEHVLTRAFAGKGVNWTLNDVVCASCNGRLSKFESHWTSSAIEAMMRNFSGPRGRKSKKSGPRAQPVEFDELYLVQVGDSLVYEAGFAFPEDFYFRAQVIDTPAGLLGVAANPDDETAFNAALASLFASPTVTVVERLPDGSPSSYWLTEITVGPDRINRVRTAQSADKPSGVWLRPFVTGATVPDMEGQHRALTARLALDDRGRLYFRAANVQMVATFLDGFHKPQATPNARAYAPGEQTIRTNVQIKLPVVFRCVMKTGLNLIAHIFGPDAARDAAFNPLRDELFNERADNRVMRRCSFLPQGSTSPPDSDFPKPTDEYQHRMMLDVHDGKIRFRVRLYAHLGYVAVLGDAPPGLVSVLSTKRVIVDFMGGGARLIETWP